MAVLMVKGTKILTRPAREDSDGRVVRRVDSRGHACSNSPLCPPFNSLAASTLAICVHCPRFRSVNATKHCLAQSCPCSKNARSEMPAPYRPSAGEDLAARAATVCCTFRRSTGNAAWAQRCRSCACHGARP